MTESFAQPIHSKTLIHTGTNPITVCCLGMVHSAVALFKTTLVGGMKVEKV